MSDDVNVTGLLAAFCVLGMIACGGILLWVAIVRLFSMVWV